MWWEFLDDRNDIRKGILFLTRIALKKCRNHWHLPSDGNSTGIRWQHASERNEYRPFSISDKFCRILFFCWLPSNLDILNKLILSYCYCNIKSTTVTTLQILIFNWILAYLSSYIFSLLLKKYAAHTRFMIKTSIFFSISISNFVVSTLCSPNFNLKYICLLVINPSLIYKSFQWSVVTIFPYLLILGIFLMYMSLNFDVFSN